MVNEVLSPTLALQTQFICGIVSVGGSCSLFVYVLTLLERNRNRLFDETEISEEKNNVGCDTVLEIEHDSQIGSITNDSSVESSGVNSDYVLSYKQEGQTWKSTSSPNRKLLPSQIMTIIAQVLILTLLNYLLLVYIPGGSAWLSFFGITSVWAVTLHKVIIDEIRFHQRIDRIFALVTLFLWIASGLTLTTYSRLALQEGHVYAGPARIVAYDATVYNNSDGQTLRANVRVTWGGEWGCAQVGQFCTADINGSLCQTQYNAQALQKSLENTEEDYIEYEEKYETEYIEGNTTALVISDTDDEDTKGFVSNIDYDGDSSITEYADGTEEVYVVQHCNGTEEVDVVYQDSKEQVHVVKENTKYNNDTANVTGVEIDYENDSNQTESIVETTSVGKNKKQVSQSTNNSTDNMFSGNKTQTKGSKSKNGERRQERRASTIDENIQSAQAQEELDSGVSEEVEEITESKADNEAQYYNEVVDEVSEVEKEDADALIYEDASLEELQQKHDELVKEIDQLQKEKSGLEEKLKADVIEEEDLDTEIENINYGDDYYDAEYWASYDWAGIWGSYSCEDMYNYDLDTLTFDPDTPPNVEASNGKESWPTMNIYGSCNTCNAYIMDYYSSEHFQAILHYKHQARSYFLWSIGIAVLASFFYIQYKHSPRNENRLDLLSSSDDQNGHVRHGKLYNSSMGDEGVLA